MTILKYLNLCIIILLLGTVSLAQDVNWYSFDKDFISSHYSDSAMTELSTTGFHPAGTIHSVSCGGNDGELHIGMSLDEADLSSGEMPLTAPPDTDPDWGFVAELPNASKGNGPAQLKKLKGKAITFQGYLRVWDEGHSTGQVFQSNPHHVFEIHPAWGFNGSGVSFLKKNLVNSMSGFSGFGVKKFKPLLQSLSGGDWPLAFQDKNRLHLGLIKAANFYQLPMRIKKIDKVTGGHEITVDVFSDKNLTKLVYSGLKCITVSGSSIDKALTVGQETFLLGFFSVNLKKALEASQGVKTEDEAIHVKEAVEFFVFGFALKSAVQTCSSH